MDCEQEERQLQFLGSSGVIKESIKIIFTWRKIFSQITLAFILPLSLIILAQMEICTILFEKVIPHKLAHGSAEANTPKYNKLPVLVTSGKIELLLFSVSFVLLVIFSFLSLGAVTFTTAHGYTLKSITFHGVMSTLPKVRKRLMITNFTVCLAFYIYIFMIAMILCSFSRLNSPASVVFMVIPFIIVWLSGASCICSQLYLAGAGAVLVGKNIYGSEAMFKSKNLIKGKLGTSAALCLLLLTGFLAILLVFVFFVSYGHGSVFLRLGIAILCFLILIMLLLFSLVLLTVIYFVWKLHHHENMDKLSLTDLLAEYFPPKADDVKLEQANVYLDISQ